MIDQMFWPFAVKATAERMNSITIDINGETPESKFYGVPLETIPVKSFHTMFCPCYVLDGRLQAAGSIGPPKWELGTKVEHKGLLGTLTISCW